MITPEQTVQAFMKAMEQLDYDTAFTYVSPNIAYTNLPLGPDSTTYGTDGIRAVLEPFFAPTITNEWVIKNIATSGNTVFIERLDRHQFEKGWAELPVTGVFQVADGLITEWREYFDYATIQQGIAAVL